MLTSKQALRRWRECNPNIVHRGDAKEPNAGALLQIVAHAHTIGAVADASFDIVDSPEAVSLFPLEQRSMVREAAY